MTEPAPISPPVEVIPAERVESRIYLVRGQKVLFDSDLAKLYGVATGALYRAVRRNAARFPTDFMFQLSAEEFTFTKPYTARTRRT